MGQLVMRRQGLGDLPDVSSLPDGYQIRVATLDDDAEIARVLGRSFDMEWDEERVGSTLLHAADVRTTFVVTFGDRVVATASSQLLPDMWPGAGLLHWVATDPDHRGMRLGYAVSLTVLHDHRSEGIDEVVLTTNDPFLPAIHTYLELGFKPLHREPDHADRWKRVLENLGQYGRRGSNLDEVNS